MEYIALGIPFIATRSYVYEDFFDCDSGIFIAQGDLGLCDISNSNEWLDAIESICADYGSWEARAKLSRDKYKSTIDIAEQDLPKFFNKLL